jgi:putative thioredoxin
MQNADLFDQHRKRRQPPERILVDACCLRSRVDPFDQLGEILAAVLSTSQGESVCRGRVPAYPSVVDVTEKTWEQEVIRRSDEQPVVVDFWADWCQPCKVLTPVLEEAVQGRDVALAKVDVEANKALANEYDISGIPAVKAFKNGRVVSEFVGAKSRTSVDAFLDELTRPPVADTLSDQEIVAALRERNYERAFEILLQRAADPEQRDEARKLMVQLFGELGHDDPLSIAYRKRLAALVY